MNEIKIDDSVLSKLTYDRIAQLPPDDLWQMYRPPRTLGASDSHQLAMDSALQKCGFQSLLSHAIGLGMGFSEIAPQFLGYPYLAGLSQNGLIRSGVTTVADEMTKRWIEIKHGGEIVEDDEKVKTLNTAFDDFGLQELFNEAAQKCDFDGGCLIYIETNHKNEDLATELFMDKSKLHGTLKRFVLVEAINLYPGDYNTSDPLAPDYFSPRHWLVQGNRVHVSRFLYFAPNKLNVLLRPAYNFFGIPTSQLVLDYVAHFTKTREAAQRLLTKFSLTVFATDMGDVLSGGSADNMDRRMQYFTQKRSNDGVLMVDKTREEITKLETPLGGVTDIVRQSLEFVAAIFRIPFVKYLGITPGGMNATGDYDKDSFYDHIASKQEKILRRPLTKVMDILQMHLFGEIDPELRAEFIPLSDEDTAQRATTQKTEADTDAIYVDRGILAPSEVRKRLSDDENSGYSFIVPEDTPEAPEGVGQEDVVIDPDSVIPES